MGEFLPALVTAAVGLVLLVFVMLLVIRSVHRVRRASAALRLETGVRATSWRAVVNSRRGRAAGVLEGEMRGVRGEGPRAGGHPAKTEKPADAPVPPAALPATQPAQVQETRPQPTRATQPGSSGTGQ